MDGYLNSVERDIVTEIFAKLNKEDQDRLKIIFGTAIYRYGQERAAKGAQNMKDIMIQSVISTMVDC